LLAFSRKQIFMPEVLDLNALIARMQKMLARVIGERVAVVVVPDPDLGRVRADPGQIEQVILNLAVNSRDAMPNGGTLAIETCNVILSAGETGLFPVAKAGPYVLLTVRDTGTGMDEMTRARVFEPFFTTKEQGKGKGLGLSTVHGIVEQSGGGVLVDSEVGEGTTWKIYLPRITAAGQPAEALGTRTPEPGGETILIVEDEASLLRLTTRVLEAQGYIVLTAADGEAAQRVLKRHDGPVHLMLSDVVMPGISGQDLAARMAELRPEMKILFTSGYTDDIVVQHGVSNASAHFLSKPFSTEVLVNTIREVLDAKDGAA
jgi:two-component system cell cycle sensor histidine kinase/response regulator CckA